MNSNTPLGEYHQTSKNNLIQSFYIIGLSLNDFFVINQKEKTGEFIDIFKEKIEDIPKLTPKIITKFPNIKNSINTISDDLVVDHCFPNGFLKIFKKPKGEAEPNFFQFEIDNIPQNYQNEEQKIYSKIYFTCLEIGESISDYFQYKKEIINLIFKYKSIKILNFDKNEPGGVDSKNKFSEILIPKVLCFSSVLPFYNELSQLLKSIYDYSLSKKDFSSLPLEKVIENIILNTPIPLKIGAELSINFKTSNYKKKISFPLCNINEININYSSDMCLAEIFRYFTSDDVIRIFKYIIYEIPILFFSENKSILSLFVNTFLSVLSPFKYPFPHIAILPKKLYGLINSEQTFIFGINQNYNIDNVDFFTRYNIELDKTLVVISITIPDNNKKNAKIIFNEKIFDNNNYDKLIIDIKNSQSKKEEFILLNGNRTHIINVDIPYIFKKKLSDGISKYISFIGKKKFFSKKEVIPKDLTFKIQNVFYKFFVRIMGGYTDYFLKSSNFYTEPKNIGEKMHSIYDNEILKEIFNKDEFISKSQKECSSFYYIFFETKIFSNFFYERLYNNNIIDQLALRQFDLLTFLKKHSEYRKKKENKIIYENFDKDILENVKADKKDISIFINEDNTFSNDDILSLVSDEDKNTDILMNYGQLITIKETNKNKDNNEKAKVDYSKLINIQYCIFPKLLFEYFDTKKNINLIFLNDENINNFKTACREKKKEYEEKRPYAFYEKLFEKINYFNSNRSYSIYHNIYLYYIWVILLSCSLWYCEKEEKKYRLDKLFEILNIIEYFEEYVLNILFINICKYGDTPHAIKFYMKYNRLMGSTNYYLLNLLCDKISQDDDFILQKNEDEEDNINIALPKRYLIKVSNEFANKRKNKLMRGSIISEDIEEILFSSEQICKKCNEIGDISKDEIIKNESNLIEETCKYKCEKCKNDNQDIIIKFQILFFNYLKKEAFITETGEFTLYTPYRLYRDLKKYFYEENNIELPVNNIFDIKEKINLVNILYYFHLLNLSYDFIFPYAPKLKSSMKLFFDNSQQQNNKVMEKKISEPIRIAYKDEVSFIYRRFNTISPLYNIKEKKSFWGFSLGTKYAESELSFTIKNSKKKGKK